MEKGETDRNRQKTNEDKEARRETLCKTYRVMTVQEGKRYVQREVEWCNRWEKAGSQVGW